MKWPNRALGPGFVFSFKFPSHIPSGPASVSVVAAGMGEIGGRMLLLTTQCQELGSLAMPAGIAPPFSCRGSSFKTRECRPVSQRWYMNPESHIKGTEMAQGCNFAFSVQDWSQNISYRSLAITV